VSQRIVDRLEAIEVHEQHPHTPRGATRPRQCGPEAVFEERAVGERGDRVIERQLMHPLLMALARGVRGGFRERPADRRNQPREPLFEHIVGGAGLERLDRRLFAQGTGDEDEGDVGATLPSTGEGREAIITRQGVVGEEPARFQRRRKRLRGLDPG
jgi:hypothetical protein